MPQEHQAVRIAEAVRQAGGRALIVGGAARDREMGIAAKDIDLEIFSLQPEALEQAVTGAGFECLQVGRSFPVWKAFLPGEGMGQAIDLALPRREKKVGAKHTDFIFVLDPHMSFAEAATRRDLTMNAIGYDPLTGETIDPHGGRADIKAGVIRHVSPHFAEDPLRVLRVAQFAARFGMSVAPETVEFCRSLSPEDLSAERINEEFRKLILKGKQPSRGLEFLRECGWSRHFPELNAMIGVPQDPKWHPEGDVWVHTLHCMDAFAERRTGNEREDLIVGFATLCHDMGKPATTAWSHQRQTWTAHGHEGAGRKPAEQFLRRLTRETELIQPVLDLVERHMEPKLLHREAQKGRRMDSALRRLSTKVPSLELLGRVCWNDSAGRPPLPREAPEVDWMLENATRLAVRTSPPAPLVRGRDLIRLGVRPGPEFGAALKAAMERQLDGQLRTAEEALAFALSQLGAAPQGFDGPEAAEMLRKIERRTLKSAVPEAGSPAQGQSV